MIINAANLKAFQFTLDTEFANAQKDTIPDANSIAKQLFFYKKALNRKKVKYPWMSASGRVEKQAKGVPAEKQRLPMNSFEVAAGKATMLLAMDEFDLKCDEEGLYVDQVRTNGSEVADFDERYAASLLTSGFSTVFGDGAGGYFFGSSRKVSPDLGANSSTYTNVIANVLGATGYDAARKKLFAMTDGKGRPRGIGQRGFTLVCGPENEAAALDLLKSQFLSSGATNKYYNTADLVVSSYLGTSVTWYLTAKTASAAGRPLIHQTNCDWESRMTGTDSETQIVNGEILYQKLWYGEHAYGDPQLIIGSTGAG